MAVFELEVRGQRYEVEAPNEAALRDALPRIMEATGRAPPVTIDILAPNGDTVQFPAGTPDSTIRDVMRREYGGPPPVTPDGTGRARQGKGSIQTGPDTSERPSMLARARDVVTGELRTEFPDAPEFSAALQRSGQGSSLWQHIVTRGLSAVTPDPRAQASIIKQAIPDLEQKQDVHGNIMLRAPSVGVAEWAYLNAPGASWRDLSEFTAGTVASAPLMPLFGAGASIPARIATGALAGAGGSVAQDAAAMALGSDQGIDVERAAVSGVVGGIAGPMAPRRPTSGPAPVPTAGQEAVLAAERIGVDVPRAMASDSRTVQMLGGAARDLPVLGSPLTNATQRTARQLGDAADRVAAGFGSAAGPLHAGDIARQGMLEWLRHGSRRIDERLYGEVERLLNPNVTAPLHETLRVAAGLAREMQESATIAPQSAINLVLDAISRPQGLTWRGAQRLRTELTDRISGSILPEAGTHMPALKLLRDAITRDMRDIAQAAGGPRAVAAWTRADELHSMIADSRKALARIIGSKGDVAPEAVFERLVTMARAGGREDFDRLMQARRAMGTAAWNEVAANAVARLGRTTRGEFSPALFLTEYGKISPNGRNALFATSGPGGLRQTLDDIAAVSRRYEETVSRYANPSGTGRAVTTMGGLMVGATAPLTALKTAIGGYALAMWLARPATARAVHRYMQAHLQAATRPGQATALLIEQAQRQLWETAEAEGLQPDRRETDAPLQPPTPTPAPAPRPDHARNQTVQALLRRGVHPANAEMSVGNPQMAIAMLQNPDLYREPTRAERIVQHAGTVAGLGG